MAHFKNIASFALCNIIHSSLAFLVGDWSALLTQVQRILNFARCSCGERTMAPFDQRREFNPIGLIFKTSQLFLFYNLESISLAIIEGHCPYFTNESQALIDSVDDVG
jgi:hypothetical protein